MSDADGGGVDVSPVEKQLLEHLRRVPDWKLVWSGRIALFLAILFGLAFAVSLWYVRFEDDAQPADYGQLGLVSATFGWSLLFYNRTRWAMVAYGLLRRVDVSLPPAPPHPPRS